jgi:hypothetical protein
LGAFVPRPSSAAGPTTGAAAARARALAAVILTVSFFVTAFVWPWGVKETRSV